MTQGPATKSGGSPPPAATPPAESATARRTSSAHERAVVAIVRAGEHLRRHFGSFCEGRDLTLQQYNVLRILRGAQPDPLPTMEIAERMMEQTPGITRLLDRLEEKGLVRRKRCGEDRRRVLCSITEEGIDLVDSLDVPVGRADRELLGVLSEPELRRMIALLDRISEAAG